MVLSSVIGMLPKARVVQVEPNPALKRDCAKARSPLAPRWRGIFNMKSIYNKCYKAIGGSNNEDVIWYTTKRPELYRVRSILFDCSENKVGK